MAWKLPEETTRGRKKGKIQKEVPKIAAQNRTSIPQGGEEHSVPHSSRPRRKQARRIGGDQAMKIAADQEPQLRQLQQQPVQEAEDQPPPQAPDDQEPVQPNPDEGS